MDISDESQINGNTEILWKEFWDIAESLSRNELALIWLRCNIKEITDDSFNRNMLDMTKFSKEDLLNILDEIPLEAVKQVVAEHRNSQS